MTNPLVMLHQERLDPGQMRFNPIAWLSDRMVKRRHSTVEIDAMLRQGDAMHRQGLSKIRIAEALGVSPMTYHRWLASRKASSGAVTEPTDSSLETVNPPGGRDLRSRIRELEVENARLRRLLTDTMLEKAALQETARTRT